MKFIVPIRADRWRDIAPRFLPFADAASVGLPLGRLLRLSMFQVAVGICTVLLVGTLNRVMIVELGVSAWLVSAMVALPLLFAPFRALLGFKSDTHRSILGWKRVPFLWMGSWLMFGGLAIMPFALMLMTGDGQAPAWAGQLGAVLAFLLVGAGMQTTQTAGLALATDLATPESRPRVVALMYVMLLFGMVGSSLLFGALLTNFSPTRLIQVVQGAAAVTMLLNMVALWKQEPRRLGQRRDEQAPRPDFKHTWRQFSQRARATRFLVSVGLGTAAFNMQDIILEPYGGEILKLSVSATTMITAMSALGGLTAFALAARWLQRGADAHRVAAIGLLAGLVAFAAVIFAEPLGSAALFRAGATLIGFGGGLFAVGTLTAAMALESNGLNGMALGAWGAVQATCGGAAVLMGGVLRDTISSLALQGWFGEVLTHPGTGYSFVYHIEVCLLFAALIAIGPLVRNRHPQGTPTIPATPAKFGLADYPG